MIALYDVYSLFDIEPVKAAGSYVYDAEGTEYLDFYGGHAVISIGHSHPHYVKRMKDQIDKMVFYSNSVKNSLQQDFCKLLHQASGLNNYDLFFCNSGAEANENALKLASFHNGRTKVLSLKKGFHGRTSAAVNSTDSQKIIAPINKGFDVKYHHITDEESMHQDIMTEEYCAVIIEAIQGIGGIHEVPDDYLNRIMIACEKTDTVFIADEVQAGYARSGDFFSFQRSGIRPDVISMAKGMGNGFPIGGVLINSGKIPAWKGMLGSTFGGSHLACAAGSAVLEVIIEEGLQTHAAGMGEYIMKQLEVMDRISEVRGRGLMIGLQFDKAVAELRSHMLYKHKIFTGSSSDKNVMRLLPPLIINRAQADHFIDSLRASITEINF